MKIDLDEIFTHWVTSLKKKPTVIKITTRHQIKRLYNLLFISKFKEIKEKENCALKTIHQ